ncbi:Putative hydroxypyruvate reductase [Pirellulimonas nuda]|uniref:Hydroxypyruvate reductase n=1 Tax=Pirellulimonas nuda TaxID=2528009 RepID=A0A518DGK6_9BACT|nr:DUF4147 domain-containing protein [Pirellulimonas nuda]QDU90606.1 Putative hydroxypyruvate reductase [Pirellulimonas nuda]
MPRSGGQLLDDALRIWRAGVEGVRPERLLPELIVRDRHALWFDDVEVPMLPGGRIAVVGAGKGGSGMVRGLEAALGEALLRERRVAGVVSVPADCLGPTRAIELVSGRPPGVNEPRPEGAAAARRMLQLAGSLGPNDLCICLLSGGGSALLPAPADGVTLEQKITLTRLLSASGAAIEQINTVRSQLSVIKRGGLARACRAGTLVTLIVSDVLGDPIASIASGPTAPNNQSPRDAIEVLRSLELDRAPAAAPIVAWLSARAQNPEPAATIGCRLHHVVVANNAAAVDAAGVEAERLGYNHAMIAATASEGAAEGVGTGLADAALGMRSAGDPNCLISGGEPTVRLAPAAERGRGGRNQQLVLAAAQRLGGCDGIALVSGGTDGEDGPTDAAGGMLNAEIAGRLTDWETADALRRNDAYPLLERVGGLLKTGPTHTNVCDLRVVVVDAP